MTKGKTLYFPRITTPYCGYEKIEPVARTISREDYEIKCKVPQCAGVMHHVESTKEEVKKQSCGRTSYACCTRAFVCDKCGMRAVFDLPAPECNW